VLLGALEEAPEARGIELSLATGRTQLAELLRAESARRERVLVLWSFYSPKAHKCALDLAWLRRRVQRPGIVHVAGGPHASAEPEATRALGFDLVAQGEGEHTIRALAAALQGGGELALAGQGERVAELDQFPPFAPAARRFNALEITRGCIYACSFCQTPFLAKARFRHRSVGEIVRWTRFLRAAGCGYVRFLSPTAFSYGARGREVDLGALEALLAGVRGSMGSTAKIYFGTFPSEVRPEHVTHEALALVKRFASNTQLVIGGQSGSDRVLESAHRGHTREDVLRAVRIAREAGFLPNVDFLFGLPG
jgi:B12-binding domain/radical SAM domain protein